MVDDGQVRISKEAMELGEAGGGDWFVIVNGDGGEAGAGTRCATPSSSGARTLFFFTSLKLQLVCVETSCTLLTTL